MSPKKILIIKLSSLGDVVHTLPVSRTLRQEYPKSYIAWIIEERYQELLHKNSDIDEVIPIRTKAWRKNWNRKTFGEIVHTIKSIRSKKSDAEAANMSASINSFLALLMMESALSGGKLLLLISSASIACLIARF